MNVLQAAWILAVVVGSAASASAAPVVRLGPASIVFPHGPDERPAFWRHGDGDHEFRRHRRQDFIGPIGGVIGEAAEPGPEAAPSPFVVAAPIAVNVTLAPAAGPPSGWTDGPKLIEIGRRAPRGRLPLVVYGD